MADRSNSVLPADLLLSFGTPSPSATAPMATAPKPVASANPGLVGSMGDGSYVPSDEALMGSMRMTAALAAAAADSPLVAAKKARVQENSLQKMAVYGSPMQQRVLATAIQQDNRLGQSQEARDSLELDPIAYAAKYGFEAEANRYKFAKTYTDLTALKNAERTDSQMYGDTALDVGVGLTNTVGGAVNAVAAVGDQFTRGAGALVGVEAPALSPYVSQGIGWINEQAQGAQSQLMQDRRVQQEIEGNLLRQDTEAQYQEDLAAAAASGSDSTWEDAVMPWLKKQGNTVSDVITNFADDPMMIGSLAGEGVGSLIPVGLAAKGIGAARAASEIAKKGLTGQAAAAVVLRETERAVPLLIGVTEGGSAITQTQQQIMSMSEADLMASPDYAGLRQGGMSHEDAQVALARDAGAAAGVLAAPGAVLAGKLTSKFVASPVAGALNPVSAVTNIGKEGLEEFLQEGQTTVASNVAMDKVAEIETAIDKGVAEAATTGAIGGVMTAGGVQAPSAALGVAGAVGSAALNGAKAGLAARKASVDAKADAADPVGTPARQAAAAQFDQAGQEALAALDGTTPNQTTPNTTEAGVTDGTLGDGSVGAAVDKALAQDGTDVTGAGTQRAESTAEGTPNTEGSSAGGAVSDGVADAAQASKLPGALIRDSLNKALFLDDSEAESYSERYASVRQSREANPGKPVSRSSAVLAAEQAFQNPDLPEDEKIISALGALDTFDGMRQVEGSDVSAEIAKLPETDVSRKAMGTLSEQIRLLESSPVLKKARELVSNLTPEKIDALVGGDAAGKAEIQRIVATVGRLNPTAVSQQAYSTVLDQVSDTDPNKQELRRSLKLSQEIAGQFIKADADRARIQQEYDDLIESQPDLAKGKRYKSYDVVRKEIETQDNENGLPSLEARRARVVQALRVGKTDVAERELEGLRRFAQHMSNKIEAYNKSALNSGRDTPFEALGPTGWFMDEKGVFAQPKSVNSMATVAEVRVDAETTTALYNSLAKSVALATKSKAPALLAVPEFNQKIQDGQDFRVAAQSEMAEKKAAADKEAADKAAAEAKAKSDAEAAKAAAPVADAPVAAPVDVSVADEPAIAEVAPATEEAVTDDTVEDEDENDETDTAAAEAGAAWFNGLKEMLFKAADGANLFLKAFKPKTQGGSLLSLYENPAQMIVDSLGSLMKANNDLTRELSFDEEQAMKDMLGDEDTGIADFTTWFDKALNDQLNKKPKKEGSLSLAERLTDGDVVQGYANFLPMNFAMEVGDGTYEIEPRVASAVFMAMQEWVLQNLSKGRPAMDAEQINKLFGQQRGDKVNDQMQMAAQFGTYSQNVLDNMAAKISTLLGVEANRNVTGSLTDGVMRAMAANALEYMLDRGLIEVNAGPKVGVWTEGKIGSDITVMPSTKNPTGKRNMTMIRTSSKARDTKALMDLKSLRDPFTRIFTKGAEKDRYVGEPPKRVRDTQLGNKFARISSLAKKVIKQRNNAPSYLNEMMLNTLTALTDKNWKAMMGYVVLPKDADRLYNKNDLIRIEGKNQSLDHALEEIKGYVAEVTKQVEEYNKANPDKPKKKLGDVPIYFDHAMSSVGRLQQLGMITPQGDKIAREMISSTYSTLDLSNEEHMNALWLAVAQSVGLKVEKDPHGQIKFKRENGQKAETMRGIRSKVEGLFAINRPGVGLQPAVNIAKEFLRTGKMDQSGFMEALMLGKDPEGKAFEITDKLVHAVMTVAQLQEAKLKKNLSKTTQFRTALALEADGKTDGPINAMIHMGIGAYMAMGAKGSATDGMFDANEIERFAKGGLFFTSKSVSLNEFIEAERRQARQNGVTKVWGEDLYHMAAKLFEQELAAIQDSKDSGQSDVLSLLDRFLPDYTIGAGIARNTIKNPLTVFLYGSSVAGIAGKITGEVMDEFYTALSAAIAEVADGSSEQVEDHAKFKGILDTFAEVVGSSPESIRTRLKENPQEFSLSAKEEEALRKAVQKHFADPMSDAINQATGGLADVMKFTQVASNVQTMIFQDLLNKAMDQKTADLRKPDENGVAELGPKDMLTANQLEEVFTELMSIAPIYGTDGETFQISAPRAGETKDTISSSFGSRFKSAGRTTVGADAGVKISPYLTIGTGDGRMILNIYVNESGSLQASLPVFDGVEQSLANVVNDSNQINKAVFQGWTEQNVYKSISDGFWQMLSAMTPEVFDSLDPETKDQIVKTLGLNKPEAKGSDKLNVARSLGLDKRADLRLSDLLSLHRKIEAMALISEARKAAIKRMASFTDHMAGSKNPHENQGATTESDDPLDFEGVASKLNEFYMEEVERLRADLKAAQVPKDSYAQKPSPEMMAMVKGLGQEVLGHPGVWTMTGAGIWALVKADNRFTPEQISLFERVLVKKGTTKSGLITLFSQDEAAAQTVYYFGDVKALEAVRDDLHGDLEKKPIQMGQSHVGTRSSIAFIAVQAPETLLHEMLHVHTLGVLERHYANPKASPDHVRDAVARLEGLVNEVLGLDPAMVAGKTPNKTAKEADEDFDVVEPDKPKASTKTALEVVQQVIRDYEGKPERQISELISYMLTNQDLIKLGQKKTVYAPLFNALRKGLAYFKRLLGITSDPGNTLFSNIRFNTEVLLAKPKAVVEAENETKTATLLDQVFGSNPVIDRLEAKFLGRMQSYLEANLPDALSNKGTDRLGYESDVAKLKLKSREIAEAAVTSGFDLDFRKGSVFQAIHSAMVSGMPLDAGNMREAQKLFTHVVDNIKASDFLKAEGIENPTKEETAKAEAMVDFLITAKPNASIEGRTDVLATFMALAQVDDSFRSVLAKMKLPPKSKTKWTSVDSIIESLVTSVTSLIVNLSLDRKNQSASVQARLDVLTGALAEIKALRRDFAALRIASEKTETANDYASSKLNQGSKKAVKYLASKEKATNTKTIKVAFSAAKMMAALGSKEASNEQGTALTMLLNTANMPEFRALLSQIRGMTDTNAPLLRMLNPVKAAIEAVRQGYRENVPDSLAANFSRKLTKSEWTYLFNGIGKADLLSMGLETSMDILSGKASVAGLIAEQEEAVATLGQKYSPRYVTKAKALARYMVTGENTSRHLLPNARAIAHMFGEEGTNRAEIHKLAENQDLITAIGKLTSLYAFDMQDGATKDSLAKLVETEKSGVEQLVAYHRAIRQAELERRDANGENNGVAENNGWKGFIPSIAAEGHEVIVADDENNVELVREGYVRIGDYKGDPREDYPGKRGYYQTTVGGRNAFRQGVAQAVHDTWQGVDARSGRTLSGNTAGMTTGEWVFAANKATNKNAGKNDNLPPGEYLIPKFNAAGMVKGYERSVDPKRMAAVRRDTHHGRMLGAWMGRILEEQLANESNREVVQTLKAIWEKEKDTRGKEFINVADKDIKDPVIRDAWDTLGWQIKADAEEIFGRKDFFPVMADQVLDAVGTRSAGIKDFWSGVSRWSPKTQAAVRDAVTTVIGNNGYKRLVQAENLVRTGVSLAKTTIVVRSLRVAKDNVLSNMLHLSTWGIDPITVAKGMRKAFIETTQYNKNKADMLKAEMDLATNIRNPDQVKRIRAKMKAIEEANARMSIAPLIKAGELSTVSEGMTEEDFARSENWFGSKVDKAMSVLPEGGQSAVKNIFLFKDSQAFRLLNRMVQYGDFLSKAVLYEHLTTKKNMDSQEALDVIIDEFVNYNRLSGRGQDLAEGLGLLWFPAYKLRIQKIVFQAWRDRPIQSLLVTGGVGPLSDVSTAWSGSFLGKLADGGLGWSFGPGMGFSAPFLNPALSWLK